MADETVLPVSIEAKDNASKDFENVADTVEALSEALRSLTTTIKPLATNLNKISKGLAATATSSLEVDKGAKEAASSVDKYAEAARRATEFTREHAKTMVMSKEAYSTMISENNRARAADIKSKGELRDRVTQNVALNKAIREQIQLNKANAEGQLAAQRQQTKRLAVPSRASNNPALSAFGIDELSKMGYQVGNSFGVLERATGKVTQNTRAMHDSLFVARFALNDIAVTAGIAGGALLAMNTAVIGAAATYESAMASIKRTSGAGATELEGIRQQFIDLAQTIPAGFDNLAQIGELAGQLNIPSQNIGAFTQTVAQFVSSTDVATQSAAEAFGRLDALLPDVQGNYDALGSSILHVGVNSVATESAIISTTTQIAAAGAQAGFAASEVIGLAASPRIRLPS